MWLGFLPALAVILIYIFPKQFYSFRFRWLNGLALYLVLFMSGSLLAILHKEVDYKDHYSHQQGEQYLGLVKEQLKERAKSYRTTVEIIQVKTESGWEKTTGNCLVYFAKDSASKGLKYGDVVVFSTSPGNVLPPSNPEQFDYRQWLSNNKIYNQVYIPSARWSLLARHQGNIVLDYAFQLREKCLSVFRQNNLEGQDYAVLSALLLGDEHEIDQETINAYQASGTLHILSVSGMHVAIIYLALNFLLGFMDKKRGSKIIKTVIVILFLWFYAALTGLAPAVLRSATMLSFMVVGTLRKNPANIYNSLLASCIFLLLINPLYIFQASFQLSYLAVIGIVLLQKRIRSLIVTGNFVLSKVWDIISVSIAAQLATFPLALLYFHQFPNYFILSNLLIIPLSSLAIYGGILLLITAPIHIISQGLGYVLAKAVHLLNDIVMGIEQLPYSTIRGVSMTVIEAWLIYLLILFLIFYLMRKEGKFLIGGLCVCAILFANQISKAFGRRHQRLMTVYNIPRKSAIAFIDSEQCSFLTDSDLVTNRSAMAFNVYQHWWSRGIDESKIASVYDVSHYNTEVLFINKNFIDFNGVRILMLNNKSLLDHSGTKLSLDYIILSKNVKTSLAEIQKRFSSRQVIIDSSNSLYSVTKWMNEAKQLNIPCYSVTQNGAFVLDLNKKML